MEDIISLKNISKGYQLGKTLVPVILDIDMNIKKGEFIALMGPSGSGKSTLMNMIGCLDIPDSGQYYLEGNDVSKFSEDSLSEVRNNSIGFIFQNFNLIPDLTVLENIAIPSLYAGNEDRQRARELAEKLGIGDRISHYPNELSGGQKQRVAIARALINNPKIILADEPTGNLDSHSSSEVMEALKSLNEKEGKTIILVTHDAFTAGFASRHINLKDGIIV
ncbi:MAG TPA: macrolide ABC transporter ATP-binding protein [Candidatus Moranbacteria bacterium]|nr:macrolide ABC transporter ATP-binding protein [Candidatus Moranbacteria bacterium]HBT46163.1 macrolide ABC transporter ATP-binding protein [Candidatus Moranbacteria bacterium]